MRKIDKGGNIIGVCCGSGYLLKILQIYIDNFSVGMYTNLG